MLYGSRSQGGFAPPPLENNRGMRKRIFGYGELAPETETEYDSEDDSESDNGKNNEPPGPSGASGTAAAPTSVLA
ncbi:hypothetical protein HDU86_001596 [Geranomyces michiganensis]|nr:hypothetical protein HDU86_001596 [Geranomyces michiganensis]